MTADRLETAPQRSLRRLADQRAEILGPHADLMGRLRATYLETLRDEKFNELLRDCIVRLSTRNGDMAREGAGGILIMGPSGAGKTRLVARNVGRHALFRGFMQKGSECAGVGVRCGGVDTLRFLATAIMRASGYPVTTLSESVAWNDVHDRLERFGIILVWIDEIHSMFRKVNAPDLSKLLMTFKGLLNDPNWPVILILSGIPECEQYVLQNSELETRISKMTLDSLEDADMGVLADHLDVLVERAGLPLGRDEMREIIPRLVHGANRQFGRSIDLILKAIESALLAGSLTLERRHFGQAYAKSTQAHDDANPFLAKRWQKVVVRHVASTNDREAWEAAAAEAAKSRIRIGIV